MGQPRLSRSIGGSLQGKGAFAYGGRQELDLTYPVITVASAIEVMRW